MLPQNELDLSSFRGRVDFDSIYLAGHSFGGATVLKALHQDHQFKGSEIEGNFGILLCALWHSHFLVFILFYFILPFITFGEFRPAFALIRGCFQSSLTGRN